MTAAAPDLYSVDEATRMVWSSVVGDDQELRAADGSSADTSVTGSVSGTVHITGGWEGCVQLSTSQAAARRATAALFGIAEEDVRPEEIVDALGELTNMVGGSIKSILPGPSKLSLPSVATGQGYVLSVPGARPVADLRLQWADEPLTVTVWAA